jgi:hypothetical protein
MSEIGQNQTISMIKNEPGTENLCLEFTNSYDTKTLDVVMITESCTPEIIVPSYEKYVTAPSYSKEPINFTIPVPIETCENQIETTLGSAKMKGNVPPGISENILRENGNLIIQSKPNTIQD